MIRCFSLSFVPLLASAVVAQEPTVRLLDIGGLRTEAKGPLERSLGANPAPPSEATVSGSLLRIEGTSSDALAAEQNPHADLERFLRTFIDPPLTEEEDVRVLGRKYLAVLGRPAQHAWVEALLAQQRQAASFQLEVRVLDAPRQAFLEHFAAWFGAADPRQKLQTTLERSPAVDRWLAEVAQDERITAVVAPRIIALPLYGCVLSIGDTLHYVRDYEVEFAGEQHRPIAKPIMDDLWDGISITAICACLPDGTVGVDFDYKATSVQRPIPQFTSSLAGDDTPLTIDLPASTVVHLQQRLALPNGGLAILCAQKDADRYAIALVRVEMQPR